MRRTIQPQKVEDSKAHGCRSFWVRSCNSKDKLCPHFKECRQYLKLHVRIPYVIIEKVMPLVTGNAWKVLCYVARKATFDPQSRNFGRTFLTYKQITNATGVKHPGPCFKKLKSLRLIDLKQTRKPSRGSYTTANTITVAWFCSQRDLKEAQPDVETANASSTPMSFGNYLKRHPAAKGTVEAIEYFLDAYKEHRGEKHPNLRVEQWREHADTFCMVSDREVGGEIETQDFETMKLIIDEYFNTPYTSAKMKVDYKIHHFNNSNNKKILRMNAYRRIDNDG